MNIHAHPALKDTGHPQALLGDKVMLAAIALSAAAAVLIGFLYYEPTLAIVGALVFLGLGAAAYALGRGTLGSRLTLALALVSLVALQIQLAHGELEYHFGVFVTLALLLVYLDWRPIVFAAGLFAVHHVLFDRLQAAGLGFYCTTEANFWRVMLHAAYVVIQTGLEVVLAVGMEVTAVGMYMAYWFKDVPQWVWVGIFSAILIGVNLRSVKVYGAVEYGFSAIKVAARERDRGRNFMRGTHSAPKRPNGNIAFYLQRLHLHCNY